MATVDLPEMPQTRLSPGLMVGVASPLWAYFGAAAAGGVAYWWMTRWARPVNLEAMLAPAVIAPLAPPVDAIVEATVDVAESVVETIAAEAPVSPALEAVLEPIVEAAPEPVIQEPVIQEPTPAFAEPAAKLKVKKVLPPELDA